MLIYRPDRDLVQVRYAIYQKETGTTGMLIITLSPEGIRASVVANGRTSASVNRSPGQFASMIQATPTSAIPDAGLIALEILNSAGTIWAAIGDIEKFPEGVQQFVENLEARLTAGVEDKTKDVLLAGCGSILGYLRMAEDNDIPLPEDIMNYRSVANAIRRSLVKT